jgi:hypothetical protein
MRQSDGYQTTLRVIARLCKACLSFSSLQIAEQNVERMTGTLMVITKLPCLMTLTELIMMAEPPVLSPPFDQTCKGVISTTTIEENLPTETHDIMVAALRVRAPAEQLPESNADGIRPFNRLKVNP